VVNSPGVDVDLFRPDNETSRTGPTKFVFVGTASRTKGFDVLLDAFRMTSGTFPSAELHVIGDAGSAARFKEQSSGNVVIHGKLGHHELAHLLGVMDCLVLPSRLESFGMAVVEALAAGIPAIVTPNVGASEIITAGKNGWIIAVGSAAALAEQLSWCCTEPTRTREMRPDCTASVARHQWVDYRRRALSIVEAVAHPNRECDDKCEAFPFARNGDSIITRGLVNLE
jgi:glycosyltransferase involved in cell wall biosynthesis